MDEARELLMAVAHQDGRLEVGVGDVEISQRLVCNEQKKRPMCVNGHPLTKGKRQLSWCNNCNNGFIPKGVDPAMFLGLPEEVQREERERTRCLITSDYLCKHCKYFCCEACFLGRGRGTLVNACIRTNSGEVDQPESAWRVYPNYDAFSGENAAEDRFAERASAESEARTKESLLEAAVDSAKSRCKENGLGGFALHEGVIYFRKQHGPDCYANLRPADGVTFHVAPRSAVSPRIVDKSEEENASERQEEHREKVESLQGLIMSFGFGSLTDVQAVYWLEQGSYVPENAVNLAVDKILNDSSELNPPTTWISSCACQTCRPKLG